MLRLNYACVLFVVMTSAWPQLLQAQETRAARLGAWLEYASHEEHAAAISTGVGGLILGPLGIGAGAIVAFDKHHQENLLARPVLSAVFVAFGGITLASGIHAFTVTTTDEYRYQRWRQLTHIDATTIARFEGQLALEAALDQRRRQGEVVAGFGLAAAGIAVVIATPFMKLHGEPRAASYTLGGLYGGLGILHALNAIFGRRLHERVYQGYLAGKRPETAKLRWDIQPTYASGPGGSLFVSF